MSACANTACCAPLTQAQIRRGSTHCSLACAREARHRALLQQAALCGHCGRPTSTAHLHRARKYCSVTCYYNAVRARQPKVSCLACGKRLTRPQTRQGATHCSIRCAMRTRHGRVVRVRTTCAWCSSALTKPQQYRRRTYCSKACAKAQHWHANPELQRRAEATAKAKMRVAFVGRLRAFLGTCTRTAAGMKGYTNGWSRAAQRLRRQGHALRFGHRDRAVLVERLSASATSHADAYRRCYELGYRRCFEVYTTPLAA